MARAFVSSSSMSLVVSDHVDLDPSTAVTVMGWFYPISIDTSDQHHLVSKHLSYSLRFSNTAAAGGLYGFHWAVWSGTSVTHFAQSTTTLPSLNRWYHVAATYDRTTMKLRVYDSVAGTVTNYVKSKSGSIDQTTTDLYIGVYQALSVFTRFDGRLSHLRIWKDIALSDGEIDRCRWDLSNYRSPVVHLPCVGSSPEVDWSGNDHTGAVSGTTVGDNPPIGPWFGSDSGDLGQTVAVAGGNVLPMAMNHYRRRRAG